MSCEVNDQYIEMFLELYEQAWEEMLHDAQEGRNKIVKLLKFDMQECNEMGYKQLNPIHQEIIVNFIDATTDEQIVSCEFIKDRLIVFFERSTWELAYKSNEIQPFILNNRYRKIK